MSATEEQEDSQKPESSELWRESLARLDEDGSGSGLASACSNCNCGCNCAWEEGIGREREGRGKLASHGIID